MFDAAAKEAGKKYYLIPYFIAAHPGTTDEDMMHLALWLKKNRYRADQVQTFLPSPMATATAMYHTEINPLRGVRRGGSEPVDAIKGLRQRRLHKAFLRYHDPENWPLLREALKGMGRADLIGPRAEQLVPFSQPVGGARRWRGAAGAAEGRDAPVHDEGCAGKEVRGVLSEWVVGVLGLSCRGEVRLRAEASDQMWEFQRIGDVRYNLLPEGPFVSSAFGRAAPDHIKFRTSYSSSTRVGLCLMI